MPTLPSVAGTTSSLMSGLTLLIPIVVIMVIMVIVVFFLINFLKFNISVIVLSVRSKMPTITTKTGTPELIDLMNKGVLKVFYDKGAYMKARDGSLEFRLLWTRKSIAPPDFRFLMPAQRGNAIILYQVSDDEFVPLKIDALKIKEKTLEVSALDTDIKFWHIQTQRLIRDTFANPSFLEKYLPYIIFGTMAVLVIVLIYVELQHIERILPAINNLANALRTVNAPAPAPP